MPVSELKAVSSYFIYSCHIEKKKTGEKIADSLTFSLAFASFHESAINNATAILEKEGKIRGKNVAPHSEEYSDPH